jgi:hypothetical protein
MNRYTQFAPWLHRIVLTLSTLLFTMIGLRYILDPVGSSKAVDTVLSSGLAVTTTRVGFGAFPLALAIFTMSCLLSPTRRLAGVILVAILIATVIVVRLIGTAMDGSAEHSTRLFVPEAVLLLLAAGGLLLESARRRHPAEEAL